ncbi:MAG: aspartyl-tRNA(Asn)/glutamyl-tRNA(Gln) amidotransferase subunit C [Candidatus Paceibacteria bacterium]|jgi:aspartyl-tRNA(Asn)/glutamyl-tRNA(Gln) amidotransferase subunit C
MKADDTKHLATLARIELTDTEITTYTDEIAQIVDYVSVVSELAADDVDVQPQVGVRYNVLRSDVVTNEPEQYTEAALREMPQTSGRHMLVKKIMKAK